eukprot:6153242-Prymnesium_polylepis.1
MSESASHPFGATNPNSSTRRYHGTSFFYCSLFYAPRAAGWQRAQLGIRGSPPGSCRWRAARYSSDASARMNMYPFA